MPIAIGVGALVLLFVILGWKALRKVPDDEVASVEPVGAVAPAPTPIEPIEPAVDAAVALEPVVPVSAAPVEPPAPSRTRPPAGKGKAKPGMPMWENY